jgi:hypothetical protein
VPKLTVQQTGAIRLAQGQIERHRRLASVADLYVRRSNSRTRMNHELTVSKMAPTLNLRHLFVRRLFLIVVALLALVAWFVSPNSYSSGDISLKVHRTGIPMTLTFVVRDTNRHPLPGIKVQSESDSGRTPEVATSESGIAMIEPGEFGVRSVFIDGRDISLNRPGIMSHFVEDCSRGLMFKVTIRK